MNKTAVISITDKLDAESICKRLGVKPRSIRLARERGVFPSGWYPEIRGLCEAGAIECPENAFNWKYPKKTTPENAEAS